MLAEEVENKIMSLAVCPCVWDNVWELLREGTCVVAEPGWSYINQLHLYSEIKAVFGLLNFFGMKPGRYYTVMYEVTPGGVVVFYLRLKPWGIRYRVINHKDGKEVL